MFKLEEAEILVVELRKFLGIFFLYTKYLKIKFVKTPNFFV